MGKTLLRSSFVVIAIAIASTMWIGCDKKESGATASPSGEPTCEQAMQHAADLLVASMPESARESGKQQIAAQMPARVAKCKSDNMSVESRKCIVAAKSNEELDKCP